MKIAQDDDVADACDDDGDGDDDDDDDDGDHDGAGTGTSPAAARGCIRHQVTCCST